jgi:hypothetical protein
MAVSAAKSSTQIPTFYKAQYPKELMPNKTSQKAYDIFSMICFPIGISRFLHYKLHVLVGKIIIPGQLKGQLSKTNESLLKEGKDVLLNKFKGTPLSLKTPDGILLDAIHLPGMKDGREIPKNGPTIIYFNGNAEKYETFGLSFEVENSEAEFTITDSLSNISKYIKRGYNVVLFNYRGVAKSQGEATRQGLILDGETVYQYVRNRLHVPLDEINLLGHSVGGAIAGAVGAMHPRVTFLPDRPFSTLAEEVRVIFGQKSPLLGALASMCIRLLDWNLDTVTAWNRVKGKKWLVYHPDDPVIPYTASLHFALSNQGKKNIPATVLGSRERFIEYYQERTGKRRGKPLNEEEKEIIRKLCEDANLCQEHNRKFLPEEINSIFKQIEVAAK